MRVAQPAIPPSLLVYQAICRPSPRRRRQAQPKRLQSLWFLLVRRRQVQLNHLHPQRRPQLPLLYLRLHPKRRRMNQQYPRSPRWPHQMLLQPRRLQRLHHRMNQQYPQSHRCCPLLYLQYLQLRRHHLRVNQQYPQSPRWPHRQSPHRV